MADNLFGFGLSGAGISRSGKGAGLLKDRIGVGIIGCGRIFDLHMLGYQGREDAAVLALADPNPRARDERAARYGIPRAFADYEVLLEDRDIDLVEILTPHHLHHRMALDALEAGKHVSLQKPPALCVSELDEIISAARRSGLTLRIYENFVFYPPIVRARRLIEEGAIGTPLNIRMRSLAGSAAGGWEVPLESWAWRVTENTCGGGPFIFDDGYHKFSIALHLFGPVEKVLCWSDPTPLAEGAALDAPSVCMWSHARGKFGTIDFTWAHNLFIKSRYYPQDDRIELTGTDGIIWVTQGHAEMLDLPPLLLYRDGRLTAHNDLEADWGVSFRDATRHLLEGLHTGSEACQTGEEARRVLQFGLAAMRSAREGREVVLDEMV